MFITAQNLNSVATAPQRIVVIGAGGFVGSAILAAAAKRGFATCGIGRSDIDLLRANSGDLLGQNLQANDAVVFVSAKAPCKDYEMFETNIVMAKNALDGLIARQPSHLLYISSDAVYSDSDAPLTEASATAPDNLHGMMHIAREAMFSATLNDVPFAALRPTLIYGASDPHNGYGPNRFRRQVQNGETVKLFGNGEERRDHVSVEDVADLAVRMLEWKTQGTLNAVTGQVTSFLELAEMTIAFSGVPVEIERMPRTGPMPHNGYRPFDASEVARLFPDFAFTALDSGLRAAYEDTRGQRK